jgi:phosphoesterase RecJ-like protein
MSLEAAARFLRERSFFLITSHARPDGDALGSELGLALALESLGKRAEVVNHDPHPATYDELPGIDRILVSDSAPQRNYDAAIVLECGDVARTEVSGLDKIPLVNIDHHVTNSNFGVVNWNDTSAAAVGEMVFRLLQTLGARIDPAVATNLYIALFTDTGSFQYGGTTPQSLETAAALVRLGADPSFAARIVYNSNPYEKIQLLGLVLQTMERDVSGRIAWIRLTDEMLLRCGAQSSDAEGFVNYPLSVKEVRVSAFIRENGPGAYRVSLRSKGSIDVATVAHRFGGGGHTNASGLSMTGGYSQVVQELLRELAPLV